MVAFLGTLKVRMAFHNGVWCPLQFLVVSGGRQVFGKKLQIMFLIIRDGTSTKFEWWQPACYWWTSTTTQKMTYFLWKLRIWVVYWVCPWFLSWLLFNLAFSRGLHISRIITGQKEIKKFEWLARTRPEPLVRCLLGESTQLDLLVCSVIPLIIDCKYHLCDLFFRDWSTVDSFSLHSFGAWRLKELCL